MAPQNDSEGGKTMIRFNVIPIKRKIAIGSAVAALLLAAVGCSYLFFNDEHSSEDAVNVSIAPDKLPVNKADFANSLPKGVTAVILVSQSAKLSDGPIITAITSKGETINLCASAAKPECKLITTASGLPHLVIGTENMGLCDASTRTCHKDGIHAGKYYYHNGIRHTQCPDSCQ